LTAELLGKETVVFPFAVSGVANDRVRNVFQMAPELVPAPGERIQFK